MTEINGRTKDELIKELERTKGYLEDNYRELKARHSTYLKTHFQELGAVKCQKSIEDYARSRIMQLLVKLCCVNRTYDESQKQTKKRRA
jgi:sugar-specific transcriptional regulator TrmB